MTLAICFVACDTTDNTPDGAQPPEQGKYENINNNNERSIKEVFDKEKISTLVSYLLHYNDAHDMPDMPTLAEEINKIKGGTQALLVSFDPTNYYYVCGYYNIEHEYSESLYCCAENYTWVECVNATDIPKTYDDKEFIVAFQFNKALLVNDIISEEIEVPDIEHFQMFKVKFEGEYNVNEAVVFNDIFI